MAENIVTLNVGGTLYTTTYSTLTRYPDSGLATMFGDTVPLAQNKDGNIFIDRDGNTFRYVLNFLRDGELTLPQTQSECRLLEFEANFYQIKPLIEQLKERHNNYIEVGYVPGWHYEGTTALAYLAGTYTPSRAKISGNVNMLRKLNLPQKYKLTDVSPLSLDLPNNDYGYVHLESDRDISRFELNNDLRDLGWELQHSIIEATQRNGNTKTYTYRDCWYLNQTKPL